MRSFLLDVGRSCLVSINRPSSKKTYRSTACERDISPDRKTKRRDGRCQTIDNDVKVDLHRFSSAAFQERLGHHRAASKPVLTCVDNESEFFPRKHGWHMLACNFCRTIAGPTGKPSWQPQNAECQTNTKLRHTSPSGC